MVISRTSIVLVLACVSATAVAVGCGGGDSVTCGSGTVQQDDQCVGVAPAAGGGGGAAGGAAGTGGGGASAGKGGAAGSAGTAGAAGGSGGSTGGAGGAGGAAGTAGSAGATGGSAGAAGGTSSAPTFAGVTAVSPSSATSLTVAWAPGKDDVSLPAKLTYNVYVATASGMQNFKTPTVKSPPGATSVDITTGLTMNTEYFVVVRAVDEAGNEDQNKAEKSGKTSADTKAPTFAGVTGAMPSGASSVKLTWAAGSDDLTKPEGLVYAAYWATDTGQQDFNKPAALSEPGATSVEVTGLPDPNANFFFVVRARDAAGNEEENAKELSGKTGPDTTAPTFAGCTSAKVVDASSIDVTWKSATDDTTPGPAITYKVWASKTPGGQDFASAPSATFTGGTTGVVTGLTSATKYYLVCRAGDASGNTDTNKTERSATTLDDSTPPVFEGLKTIDNVTTTSADLSWTDAVDDKSPAKDIVYEVYQATSAGQQVFSTPGFITKAGVTKASLTGLTPGTTYYWVVRAKDKAGNKDTNTNEKSGATLVSFKTNIQPIFTKNCVTECHGGTTPLQNMNLSPGFAYSNIVGVDSLEKPGMPRVKAGDAAGSYLYAKVVGDVAIITGSPMPASASLPTSDKDLIKNWINQGALNN